MAVALSLRISRPPVLLCGQCYCDVPAFPSSLHVLWVLESVAQANACVFIPPRLLRWQNSINWSFRRPRCPLPPLLQLFVASTFITLVRTVDKPPGHCCLVAVLQFWQQQVGRRPCGMLTPASGVSSSFHLRMKVSRVVGFKKGQEPSAALFFQTRILFALWSMRVCWQTMYPSLRKAAQSTQRMPPFVHHLRKHTFCSSPTCHIPLHCTQLCFRTVSLLLCLCAWVSFPTVIPREWHVNYKRSSRLITQTQISSFADILVNGSLVILSWFFIPYRTNCIPWKQEIKKVKCLLK